MSKTRMDRKEFYNHAPAITTSLLAAGKAIDESGLDKGLLELVKLRASQINGCAYCIYYHLDVARKLGVDQAKLDLVSVWYEVDIFTERECAALAWAETLTTIAEHGVYDEDYAAVAKHFSESEIAYLTSAIAVINSWNRISIAFNFAPTLPKAGA